MVEKCDAFCTGPMTTTACSNCNECHRYISKVLVLARGISDEGLNVIHQTVPVEADIYFLEAGIAARYHELHKGRTFVNDKVLKKLKVIKSLDQEILDEMDLFFLVK